MPKSNTGQNFYPKMKIKELEYNGPVASNSYRRLRELREQRSSDIRYQSSQQKSFTTSERYIIPSYSVKYQRSKLSNKINQKGSIKSANRFPNIGSKSARIRYNQVDHRHFDHGFEEHYNNHSEFDKSRSQSSLKRDQDMIRNRSTPNSKRLATEAYEGKIMNDSI